MAKREIAAPGGRAIRKRPSITSSRGFSKVRCSSVKASGGSSTPFGLERDQAQAGAVARR